MWNNLELVKPTSRGFVYLIVNTVTGMLYIGKKNTFNKTSKAVVGRKNRAWTTKVSNWKEYYGSSKTLTADIIKLGKSKFKRYILGAFDELHSVNYAEADLQFHFGVLCDDADKKYYNRNIKVTTMRYPTNRDYLKVAEDIIKRN